MSILAVMSMAESDEIVSVPGLSKRLRREVERFYPQAHYPADWPSPEAHFARLIRLAADELDRMEAVLSGKGER